MLQERHLRLGAEVHIVYRRSEAELPARVEEVHHAKEEGIIFDLLTNPVKSSLKMRTAGYPVWNVSAWSLVSRMSLEEDVRRTIRGI